MGVIRSLAAIVVLFTALASASDAWSQTAENVAVVINLNSEASQRIGDYYVSKRGIPPANVIRIRTSPDDAISRDLFNVSIRQPIATALTNGDLQDRVLYIVLTKGVPLRIDGPPGPDTTMASVDSELALLYRQMTGINVFVRGRIDNPYFAGTRDPRDVRPFTHKDHDIYLVTRLDAFTVDEAIALINRGLAPVTDGRVVLDQQDRLSNRAGEDWLARAADRLTASGQGERVVLENTVKPARGVKPVLGYYSWGSSDPRNRVRTFEMGFVPGALAATFAGPDARTFREPPAAWVPSSSGDRRALFADSAQSLIGDLIREGATGVAGHVSDPYLQSVVRPDILFPAYLAGLNLAEAYYAAIPHLSWQTVVIGDPLCAPFRRTALSRADIENGPDPVTELPALFSKRRLASSVALAPDIPERAIALAMRAERLIGRGDRKGGRAALEEAVGLAPRFVAALITLSSLDELANDHAAAEARYRRVLEIEPNQPIALNNLAYSLAVHQQKPAEALPLAKRAVSVTPNEATVLDTLGWIHHLLGDREEAVKVMQQVAKLNPRHGEIRLHAAIVFAAAGARAVAEGELAEALKLNPALAKSEEVRQLRERLRQSAN